MGSSSTVQHRMIKIIVHGNAGEYCMASMASPDGAVELSNTA